MVSEGAPLPRGDVAQHGKAVKATKAEHQSA